jgi:hypothetical protein
MSLRPSYKIKRISETKFEVYNYENDSTYTVERKPKTFKSGKTYLIWQCTCPSYQKWSWKTHSCKHLDMLRDTGDIK